MPYQATITVSACADDAYHAIAEQMHDWWNPMSAPFLKVGDTAKTNFGGESYWIFEAITLQKPHLIELKCCEAHHLHDGLPDDIKEEWLGSVLKFEIKSNDKNTTIKLTHLGLEKDLLCYEVCRQGWDYFFVKSLKNYLNKK